MDLICKAARMQKIPPANAEHTGDMGSIPELGRSPGVGKSNILQNSCLENSMDRGTLWATALVWQRLEHNWALSAHTCTFKLKRSST